MADKIRITYKKNAPARHLGHLDVLRTFVRTLRRACLPVKYSEGFNPHVVMTFALPTGVGVTSECDVAEISLTERISESEFKNRFNESAPEGLFEVVEAEYASSKMPEIVKAEYEIEIFGDFDIENFLNSKEILIEKKSKKKITEINLAEHITDSKVIEKNKEYAKIALTLPAGNTFNVKPQLVAEALSKCEGSRVEYALFHRKKFIFL